DRALRHRGARRRADHRAGRGARLPPAECRGARADRARHRASRARPRGRVAPAGSRARPREPHGRLLNEEAQRRARFVRRARVVVLALVIGYFFLPYDVKAWIPVWLPFLAAVALEVQFFVAGYRAQPTRVPTGDRGPQPQDLAELGWEPEFEDEEF